MGVRAAYCAHTARTVLCTCTLHFIGGYSYRQFLEFGNLHLHSPHPHITSPTPSPFFFRFPSSFLRISLFISISKRHQTKRSINRTKETCAKRPGRARGFRGVLRVPFNLGVDTGVHMCTIYHLRFVWVVVVSFGGCSVTSSWTWLLFFFLSFFFICSLLILGGSVGWVWVDMGQCRSCVVVGHHHRIAVLLIAETSLLLATACHYYCCH